jgi:predicted RNA-binding Zn ribbon-like protein
MNKATSKDPQSGAEPTVVQMAATRAARRRRASTDSMGFQYGTGSLCLDFAATLVGRGDEVVDLLSTAEQLAEWLRGPGLPLPAGGLTDDDLSVALGLRAALAAVARAVIAGRPALGADVRRINACARHPTPVYFLRPEARGRTVVEEVDLAATLSVIARDAVHLLAAVDTGRLRECAREGCSTLFLDRSPSGRRRWCSMKGCGEMVASASYRRRRTEGGPR